MTELKQVLDRFDEQDAGWKERTAEGIEHCRKGDASLMVTDGSGRPVSGATVRIKQKNHAFRFGANCFMLDELETDEKNETYKCCFAELFNMATLPFYWNPLEPERGKPRFAKDSPKSYRRPAIDLCLDFCEKNGIEPREHALAYEHHFPKWLHGAGTDEVKRELERQCATIAERYADRIRTIEVTNEMMWKKGMTAFYDEPDFVEWCFKTARKYFPKNQLVINEHTSDVWGQGCRATDQYYSYIEANLLKGAPIDAIGMQYHLFYKHEDLLERTQQILDSSEMRRHMDLYANFGKPLQITEVTVPSYSWNAEDEEQQAELIERLYSVWFSHPSVEQIIYWNLVDGYAHVENATVEQVAATQGNMTLGENYYHGGLLRFDLSPKPAFRKLRELICERWHTEIEAATDANGAVSFRGFYGSYDVEISAGGKAVKKQIDLIKGTDNHTTVTLA